MQNVLVTFKLSCSAVLWKPKYNLLRTKLYIIIQKIRNKIAPNK